MQLSWDCLDKLNTQEEEDADDVRFSVRFFKNCLGDKKKFCEDVEPGNARVKDCLEENRLYPDFSPECKAEIDDMIQRRVRDFKLDFRLRNDCAEDIETTCAASTIADGDDGVILCLQVSVYGYDLMEFLLTSLLCQPPGFRRGGEERKVQGSS